MTLQIQMIGTGSAFAKSYYNNNALVRYGEFTLLIDCGHTAPRALQAIGLTPEHIDAVLITHIHADHVGGLEEFAFQLLYKYKKRTRLIIPATLSQTLWEHSLRGGLENPAENLLSLQDYFDVVSIAERTSVRLDSGLCIKLLPSVHIPSKPSYSVMLNENVFYSADAILNADLLNELHADGCKAFLHDCQLSSPGFVHATLDELLTLPGHIQEKMLLMHYDDDMPKYIGRTGPMTFMEQAAVYTF